MKQREAIDVSGLRRNVTGSSVCRSGQNAGQKLLYVALISRCYDGASGLVNNVIKSQQIKRFFIKKECELLAV